MVESIKERPKKRGRYGRYLMDSDPLATIPRSTKERLGISDQPHEDPGSHESFPHLLEELDSFFPATAIGSVSDTLVSSEM